VGVRFAEGYRPAAGAVRVPSKYLHELNSLFGHRGDSMVIMGLDGHPPLRYSELATAIVEEAGERMNEGELSRCLSRLVKGGVVFAVGPKRRQAYGLTELGGSRAETLKYLISALECRDDFDPDLNRPDEPDDAGSKGDGGPEA
jgi:hypothetical protein